MAPPSFDVDGVLFGLEPLSPLSLPQEAQCKKFAVEVTKLEARVSDRFKAKQSDTMKCMRQALSDAAATMRSAAEFPIQLLIAGALSSIVEVGKTWNSATKPPRAKAVATMKTNIASLCQAIPIAQSLGLPLIAQDVSTEYTEDMAALDSHFKQPETVVEEMVQLAPLATWPQSFQFVLVFLHHPVRIYGQLAEYKDAVRVIRQKLISIIETRFHDEVKSMSTLLHRMENQKVFHGEDDVLLNKACIVDGEVGQRGFQRLVADRVDDLRLIALRGRTGAKGKHQAFRRRPASRGEHDDRLHVLQRPPDLAGGHEVYPDGGPLKVGLRLVRVHLQLGERPAGHRDGGRRHLLSAEQCRRLPLGALLVAVLGLSDALVGNTGLRLRAGDHRGGEEDP